MLEHVPHERMPALVVRDDAAFGLGHDARLALGAGDDALHGLLNLVHGDALVVPARREQRRFVHEVRKIGTGEANGELREFLEAHVLAQRLVRRMYA